MVETKLAADLGVSRSPVREAIRLLCSEGLLVEQEGSLYVFQPTVQDFQELYELRLAIEPAAARKAALVQDSRALGVLERNLGDTRACLEAGNMTRLIQLNYEFHRVICELSGNARFLKIVDTVSALIRYYCLLVLNINQQQTNIWREHTDIYTAIQEGRGQRAYDAMYQHIMKDLEVIQRQAGVSLPDRLLAEENQ